MTAAHHSWKMRVWRKVRMPRCCPFCLKCKSIFCRATTRHSICSVCTHKNNEHKCYWTIIHVQTSDPSRLSINPNSLCVFPLCFSTSWPSSSVPNIWLDTCSVKIDFECGHSKRNYFTVFTRSNGGGTAERPNQFCFSIPNQASTTMFFKVVNLVHILLVRLYYCKISIISLPYTIL